tara:strand:+ start:24 stop:152 length:129 start_codon:yes stop_codon:yes gene_type:complete
MPKHYKGKKGKERKKALKEHKQSLKKKAYAKKTGRKVSSKRS